MSAQEQDFARKIYGELANKTYEDKGESLPKNYDAYNTITQYLTDLIIKNLPENSNLREDVRSYLREEVRSYVEMVVASDAKILAFNKFAPDSQKTVFDVELAKLTPSQLERYQKKLTTSSQPDDKIEISITKRYLILQGVQLDDDASAAPFGLEIHNAASPILQRAVETKAPAPAVILSKPSPGSAGAIALVEPKKMPESAAAPVLTAESSATAKPSAFEILIRAAEIEAARRAAATATAAAPAKPTNP